VPAVARPCADLRAAVRACARALRCPPSARGGRQLQREAGPLACAAVHCHRFVAPSFRAGGCCLRCCQPPVPRGAGSCRRVAASSRCAGGRSLSGRYLLTCLASPVTRVVAGGIVQVRRCRQLPRSFAAGCQRVQRGPAAPAGLTPFTSEAMQRTRVTAPCHRARCAHLQECCHQHVRRASGTSTHNASFERYGAMLSCRTCAPTAAPPSAFPTGQQRQPAQHLFRAVRLRAIVPEVFTYSSSAISRRGGPAAPAGMISLSSEAAPCHRAKSATGQQLRQA